MIRGRSADPDEALRLLDRWERDLRPGAAGFLGHTSGLTTGGELISIVRFTDGAAALANSDRPEQSAWWAAMEQTFASPPTFAESGDVTVTYGMPRDDAGFVQVMNGTCSDRDALVAAEAQVAPRLPELRPDLLGVTMTWWDGTHFTEVAYFTSEDEARRNERLALPDDLAELMALEERIVADLEYLDLSQPRLG
jgi:hypothetical protein